MPIVINRNTGAVKPQKITQEQRDFLGRASAELHSPAPGDACREGQRR